MYVYINGWMDGWIFGCMNGWIPTLPPNNNDNSSLINCNNNIGKWLINNNLLQNIDKKQLINISKNVTQH